MTSAVSAPSEKPQVITTSAHADPARGISVDVHVKVNVSPEALQQTLDTLLKHVREAGVDVSGLVFKGLASAASHLGANVGLGGEDKHARESFVSGALRGAAGLLERAHSEIKRRV